MLNSCCTITRRCNKHAGLWQSHRYVCVFHALSAVNEPALKGAAPSVKYQNTGLKSDMTQTLIDVF